jgi:SAM-dependent methyltransferase
LTNERFYDEPRYYDIAFAWDPGREVAFLKDAEARHARRPVRSIIELGCGTGAITVALSRQGYQVAGLDLARPMLDFARSKVAQQGLAVELFLKDMAEFSLFRRFDAAACFRNTFSYLNPVERAASHFRHVAQHVEPGGVYVIDLVLVPVGCEPDVPAQEWTAAQDQVKVEARWQLVGPWDPAARTITERLTLAGEERGWHRRWEQEAILRLYSLPELVELASADGYFLLGAAYRGFDIGAEVTELDTAAGHVVVVLVRTDKPTPRPVLPDPPAAEQRWGDRGARGRSGSERGDGRRGGRDGGRSRDADRYGNRRRPAVSGSDVAPEDRRATDRPSAAVSGQVAPGAGVPSALTGDAGAAAQKKSRRRRRGPRKDKVAGPTDQSPQ